MLPYYMKQFISDWVDGRYFQPGWGDADQFVFRGLPFTFDSPTHDVYVYKHDWCMYPSRHFRYWMAIPHII